MIYVACALVAIGSIALGVWVATTSRLHPPAHRRRPAAFVARMAVGALLLRLGARLEPEHRYEVTSDGSPGSFHARPVPSAWAIGPTPSPPRRPRARGHRARRAR